MLSTVSKATTTTTTATALSSRRRRKKGLAKPSSLSSSLWHSPDPQEPDNDSSIRPANGSLLSHTTPRHATTRRKNNHKITIQYSILGLLLILAVLTPVWQTFFVLRSHHDSSHRTTALREDNQSSSSSSKQQQQQQQQYRPLMIQLPDETLDLYSQARHKERMHTPLSSLFHHGLSSSWQRILNPDYNGLQFQSVFGRINHTRTIPATSILEYHWQRRSYLYAIDDKRLRSVYDGYQDRTFHNTDCRPPAWQYQMHPNCNVLHELTPLHHYHHHDDNDKIQYLGHGYYRETYRYTPQHLTTTTTRSPPPFVLKQLRYHDEFDFGIKNQRAVLREAVVLEALGRNYNEEDTHNTLAQLYGYCSMSTVVESGWDMESIVLPKLSWQTEAGQATRKQLQQHQDALPSLNALTPHQKVHMAYQMALSLVQLHGSPNGVIVHDDVSLEQWMMKQQDSIITTTGKNNNATTNRLLLPQLFLSDVNNAEVLDFNVSSGQYCPYEISYPYGNLRPAEAYEGGSGLATESVDVWSYGTLLFSLLTGLLPFYDTEEDSKSNQEKIVQGHIPTVPNPEYYYTNHSSTNSSWMEQELYRLMGQCFQYEPTQRISMFAMVESLQHILEQQQEEQEQ